MKSILCLTVCAFSLLAFASTAQSDPGAEANGDFDFGLAGATGVVAFDGGVNSQGIVHGQMSFSATVDIEDPEGTGGTVPLSLTLGVQFDCMLADGNRAAMSGVISSASAPEFIGQQALLVVEDQVEGISPTRDAFAWGVYQPTVVNVNAKDYDFCPDYTPPTQEELGMCGEEGNQFPCPMPPPPACNFDGVSQCEGELCNNVPGASLTWTATDYDLCPQPDPEGQNEPPAACVSDPNPIMAGIPTTVSVVVDGTALSLVDCASVPLSSYPLNLIPQGGGNKVVVKIGT